MLACGERHRKITTLSILSTLCARWVATTSPIGSDTRSDVKAVSSIVAKSGDVSR